MVLVEESGSWPSYRNHLHCWLETRSPLALTSRVVEPSGGERCVAGSIRFIDWAASVPWGGLNPGRVSLELSSEGQNGPWQVLATDLPGNGRYQWRVNDTPTETCHLRLRVATATDTSWSISERFTILPGAAVTVPTTPLALPPALVLAPNPARTGTWLIVNRAKAAHEPGASGESILIEIFDVAGRRVWRWSSGLAQLHAGSGRVFWDGRDAAHRPLPSGVYVVRLQGGSVSVGTSMSVDKSTSVTRRLTIVR
jgi:hypothetical protein